MGTLLTTLSEVVSQTLTWAGDVVDTIVGNPLLLMTTGVLMLGASIGIVGRLLSKS